MSVSAKDHESARRLRSRDDAVIRHGAAQLRQSVSDYLTATAADRVNELLVDQCEFAMDLTVQDEFTELLDRPTRHLFRPAGLLARPRRIGR